MHRLDCIIIYAKPCGGRPCIRQMSIRVKDVLEILPGGETQEEILVDFPNLEAKDIRASMAYVASYRDHITPCCLIHAHLY